MPFFKRVGALPADDPKLAEVLVDRTDNLVLGDAASQLKPILTQTRDLPSTVRGAARFIDRSGLGRLGTETANVAKAAAGGAALPGAFGYMAGGEEGAASAIGASAPFIAAGLGYGSLLRFNNKSDLLAKQLGDLEYHKQSLTETERANFEKLDKDQQVAISTFSQFFPDVEIRMKSMGKDGPNGAHYVDGSDSVIEINTDTNLSYGTILSHEIGHHVERHGLLPNILEEMLGNPEKGKVGIFTKIDKATGKPKITTDENGMKHYELTDEFRELQKAYVDKLANSNVSEKAKQAYETPEQFARELFAEIVAERMLSGKTFKRAGQSSTYKLIESLGDRITSGGFMRKAMHSLGMATTADGSLVQGTGILGKPFKSSKQLDNLVKRYEDETIGLSESEIREQRPVTKDDELDTVIVSPSDPIESLQVFNNGGHFKTDKDGNIIVNPITKKPEVYSPSETRRANQALARDLTESIKARENDLPEGHVTLSETEDGKLTGSGKFIDDSIIDELSRTGRYNPSQINFLREASKAGREGIGNQMLLFYYAATGKGGRKYKTLKGGYRDSLVYGITITKDGNVILDTVSLDKLQKNIDYLLKRRGNEIAQAFGGSDSAKVRKNFESMFEKYLDNHAKGIVNGTPESGITEGQKNFLNAAFGPVSKSQIADNPTLSNLGERRANTLGTYRSRRLDRIGTLNPTGNTRNIVIDRIRRNLMPGRSEADVQITDKLFMPASEAGAGKGKQAEAADLDFKISTRNPTAKNATENPITEDLIINTASIADDATMLESHALALQEYPGIKKNSKVPKRIIDRFVDHVVDNLLYLHDQVRPEVRNRSKLWYDGARNITEKWNQKYGNDKQAIAAALASLSPQKDWFMNVDLARRMLDIYKDQSDFAFDKAMAKKYIQLFEKGIGKKKATEIAEAMVGKTLNELQSDFEQAAFIRSYDEVYNPREYQVVSPEGDFIGLAKSLDGVNKKVAWGSMTEISKAVKVLRNPSKESISTALGNAHKIRNFYNNILLPNADEFSVTIDTHAIAAALLRPLAGADLEVANNFGSKPKGAKRSIKNSSVKGISGTYGIYADAYRKAAEARGILPREMQSITWEAIRGLYEAKWKTKSNKAKIDNLWKKYENGELTLNETREQILESAGGITEPEWVTERSNSGADGTNESANKSQELYRPELGGSELRTNPRRGRTNSRGSQEVNFLPAGNFSRQPANRITRQAPAMPGNRFMLPAATAGAKSAERFR